MESILTFLRKFRGGPRKFWKSKIESITENVARLRLKFFRNNKEFEMGFRKFEKYIFVFDVGLGLRKTAVSGKFSSGNIGHDRKIKPKTL